MTATTLTASGASDSSALSSGNDGTLVIQTGPSGGKVNALTLDAAGGAALLGALTQAGIATPKILVVAPNTATGGTFIDFTSIPSWVYIALFSFSGLSLSGIGTPMFQIGDAGGVETAGYSGSVGRISGGGAAQAALSTGFSLIDGAAAAQSYSGCLRLIRMNSTTWQADSNLGRTDAAGAAFMAGTKALSPGPLDRVRFTADNGTDTIDLNGGISAIYIGF